MVFENGVKNVQAAAYNGARTVYILIEDRAKSTKLKQNISGSINFFTQNRKKSIQYLGRKISKEKNLGIVKN